MLVIGCWAALHGVIPIEQSSTPRARRCRGRGRGTRERRRDSASRAPIGRETALELQCHRLAACGRSRRSTPVALCTPRIEAVGSTAPTGVANVFCRVCPSWQRRCARGAGRRADHVLSDVQPSRRIMIAPGGSCDKSRDVTFYRLSFGRAQEIGKPQRIGSAELCSPELSGHRGWLQAAVPVEGPTRGMSRDFFERATRRNGNARANSGPFKSGLINVDDQTIGSLSVPSNQ
jgi:hypothetical protein